LPEDETLIESSINKKLSLFNEAISFITGKPELKLKVKRSADIQLQVSQDLNDLDVESISSSKPGTIITTSDSILDSTLDASQLTNDIIDENPAIEEDKIDFFEDKLIEQALEIFEAKISQ